MQDETEVITAYFAGALPDGWFEGAPEVEVDREEILVVGELPDVELGKDASEAARAEARRARIASFREETRGRRIRIAAEAQRRFRRKVSWGASCGDLRALFTTVSLPAMTRLRMDERRVLDTLVDAGVARSRSHALGWCVRLVAEHESEWIEKLQEALVDVEKVRAEGPTSRRKS
jgi:hypothetical protein